MTELIIENIDEYWCVARISSEEEREKYKYPKFVPVNGTRFSTPEKALKEMNRLLQQPGYVAYKPSELDLESGKVQQLKDIA